MLLKTRLSEVNGVFRGFRRWLAVAGLILSAVLMVSTPWRNVPDIAAFSTVFSAEEPSGTSEVFDPFGLLPEDAVQQDEGIFGQMPDMRIMYEGMEILGDVTDLSQLTDDQREALAQLGIQPEALVENRAMLETRLEEMSVGGLLGLWFQSLFVGLTMKILTICIMLVVYGRMIEIYLVTSVAPIPMATMTNHEWGSVGQNYLKSLLALGFQAFLIMVCVGIYAVLVQNISVTDDISGAIWSCMGYTVLLCFTLFKTGSLAKSIFSAH